jgi:hypothetical protein
MPITVTETAALVNDALFKRRSAAAFVRHAAFLLQRTNAQLTTSHAAFSNEGVRDAAAHIVRSVDRDDVQVRLAYLLCAVPAMSVDAADGVLLTSVETAFPSLISPASRA